MAGSTIFAVLLFLSATTWAIVKRRRADKPSVAKPLLVGDLHFSPDNRPLLNWHSWAVNHGSVVSAKLLFGRFIPVVVLNTIDSAAYFFSRPGGHCNDRPASVSMELLTGVDQAGKSRFSLMHDYDPDLKLRHRILTPSLGPLAVHRYQAVMDLEVRQLLVDIVESLQTRTKQESTIDRDELHPLLERAMASIVLALHYGIRTPDIMDPVLKKLLAQHSQVQGLAARPWLIDLIPVLRHLPTIISPWRRSARAMFEAQSNFNLWLLQQARSSKSWNAAKQADAILAKEEHDSGTNGLGYFQPHSLIADVDLAYLLATSVEGGMETVSRQALWLLVAAATHSETLQRVHGILDAVVGRQRLPLFSDRAQLAYLDAFVAETMRWRPIAALGIPRRTGRADAFEGVRVDKGVTIVANSWSIGRDPVYEVKGASSSVEDFVPERWLQDHEMDRDVTLQGRLRSDLSIPVFGHGRRGCLGQRVALDGLFLHAAVLFWAFDIEVADGEHIDSMAMEVSGFMVLPAPFNLVLKPRGPWVLAITKAEWYKQEKDIGSVLGVFSA